MSEDNWSNGRSAPRGEMSEAHKDAIAQGRAEAAAVRAYLDALASTSSKPGRPVTIESLEAKLSGINAELASGNAKALQRLALMQERRGTEARIEAMRNTLDPVNFETGFVRHALKYSGRKDISYATWREFGVPASVLREAGITAGS